MILIQVGIDSLRLLVLVVVTITTNGVTVYIGRTIQPYLKSQVGT